MKIIADENIPALDPLFGHLGKIIRLPGRQMSPEHLVDADLLLVRSITSVNAELLQGSSVSFVGTATIGTDHVDQAALTEQGIHFASAPGCNADAVAEYVISALLHLAEEASFSLLDKVVGIVGVGNVGSRLARRLGALGVKLLLCDPPKVDADPLLAHSFVSLEYLMAHADVVTLHTPLTHEGSHPTYHLVNQHNLACLKTDAILINAGRGPVVDNQALLAFSQQRSDVTLVLDVWEEEPLVNRDLAKHVKIATPHIAGYSLEGKIRGTWMLYQAYCRKANLPVSVSIDDILPRPEVRSMYLSESVSLLTPVKLMYDPYRDDRVFRNSLSHLEEKQKAQFDQLRKNYPVRREFSALQLSGSDRLDQFNALGFSVSETY